MHPIRPAISPAYLDWVLQDIFEVQEELTRSIVAAIAPHIDDAEREQMAPR